MTLRKVAFSAALLLAFAGLAAPAESAPPAKKPSPFPSAAAASASAPYVEEAAGAKLDWTEGTLAVSGTGSPGDRGPVSYRRNLAIRAATADAFRRLAGSLEVVRVDTNTRVKDLIVTDDAMQGRLNDFVKGAHVVETNYWPDGTAEVVLGVDLRGERSLKGLASGETLAPVASGKPKPKPSTAPAPKPSKEVVTAPVPLRDTYSSIIIDAHGMGASAALLPNVRDHAGKVIDLGLDAKTSVKYVKEGPELDPSAGFDPLAVRAVKTQGPLKADFVLSAEADAKLKQALEDKKLAPGTPVIVRL